jgi:hypothetical protein
MEGQKKGNVAVAAVVAAFAIGALLVMGLKSVNTASKTEVNPTQVMLQNTVTPEPTTKTVTSGSLDTELTNIDTKMGGLDTYQTNIDNAINDKPIDTGL